MKRSHYLIVILQLLFTTPILSKAVKGRRATRLKALGAFLRLASSASFGIPLAEWRSREDDASRRISGRYQRDPRHHGDLQLREVCTSVRKTRAFLRTLADAATIRYRSIDLVSFDEISISHARCKRKRGTKLRY